MKFSDVMKGLLASALLLGGFAAETAMAARSNTPKKPNVLMFLTDDAGMDQLTLYGYNSVPPAPQTPNLAALQSAGLTFRNAWTMPACSTARGVLYTGRYPFRTQLEAALGPSDLANSMISPYELTIPKLMAKAGYATALFGKFHVGLQGNNPYGIAMVNALGWQHFDGWLDETGDPSSIDTTAGGVAPSGTYPNGYVPGTETETGTAIPNGADYGACYASNGKCQAMSTPVRDPNPAGRQCRDQGGIFVPLASCVRPMPSNLNFQTLSAHYVSPLVIGNGKRARAIPPTDKRARTFRNVEQTDAAIKWIKQQQKKGKPWFATVSTATVHTPLQVPPRSTLPANAPGLNNADISTDPDPVANQMIQAMDYEFGRLLTSTGLAKKVGDNLVLTAENANTIIIYVNDNGSLGSQVRLPFDPYRAKGTAYQTGVWTPMVIAGARVNPLNKGENVEALVDISDLYQLIGNLGGIDVRKNNPYIVDSVPMAQYLVNNEADSERRFAFTFVGPNLQANGGMNGPCQFPGSNPPSCSQIPVTKGVCEDNGGTWFGEGATGSYPTGSTSTPIPPNGFKYCCQVQKWIADNGGVAGTVIPTTSLAVRDLDGYKLVRNQWNNYSASSPDGCEPAEEEELYRVSQYNTPLSPDNPRLDITSNNPALNTQIAEPYTGIAAEKYTVLSAYMNTMLASQPNCLAQGDGNGDGLVNLVDLANWKKMVKITSGSSWYDVNTDGYTNGTDQSIIVQNLGLNCNPPQ